MSMDFNLFMNDVVRQARQEIEMAGYQQLQTAEDVETAFANKGTTLVTILSMRMCRRHCPCSSSTCHSL